MCASVSPAASLQRHLRDGGGVVQGLAVDVDGVMRDDGGLVDFAADGGSGPGDAAASTSTLRGRGGDWGWGLGCGLGLRLRLAAAGGVLLGEKEEDYGCEHRSLMILDFTHRRKGRRAMEAGITVRVLELTELLA